MSKKNYGWAEMPVMGYIEGSTNVRPIIVKCHEENKSGILHYVLYDRYSACGNAKFMSSFLDIGNRNILITNPDNPIQDDKKLLETVMICDECRDSPEWKEYIDGRERDINGN